MEGIETVFESKKEKYSELFAACTEDRWKASTYPAEVSCRGFTGKSLLHFLKPLGITGFKQRKALSCGLEETTRGG